MILLAITLLRHTIFADIAAAAMLSVSLLA